MEYELNVNASDGGDPPCVTPAKLHINVIGVNKYPPEICYNNICGVQSAKVRRLNFKLFVCKQLLNLFLYFSIH